ncbi:cytochrome b/b6 domain-containing protein [Palleronia caenipelagi]|uniref:Cytochrome B n=1 Tax=Palleronia caenipelagi TaxID=2489174 RepID=A0A547PRD3_9RHOB|nr:cytochrome b/b6 domain-containing protein [Palleronia caenipelagi]TRD16641.1 cytochrome B [Palleronia caenipelagi]
MAALNRGRAGGEVSPPNPWDPLVRFSHWFLAAAIVANALLNKEGGTWHIWIGWAAIAVLAIRIIWGVVGPYEARFSAFPPSLRAARRHVGALFWGRAQEYPSHNPAGALMVYALWGLMAVTLATGLVMTGAKGPMTIASEKAAVAAGDWSVLVKESDGHDGEHDDDDEIAEEIHEAASNLILFLALLHLGGVLIESKLLRRNLIRPMLWRRNT